MEFHLTDIIMPHMSGRQLHERVRESRPEMRALFISGYHEEDLSEHGGREAFPHFLQKPFSPRALALRIRTALDSPGGA